jgi:hypothetical protein
MLKAFFQNLNPLIISVCWKMGVYWLEKNNLFNSVRKQIKRTKVI